MKALNIIIFFSEEPTLNSTEVCNIPFINNNNITCYHCNNEYKCPTNDGIKDCYPGKLRFKCFMYYFYC